MPETTQKPVKGIILKRSDGSEVVNYNIEGFPAYIHEGYVYPGCTWERVPHYHDDIEIVSVYSGSMAYSVDGINISLKKLIRGNLKRGVQNPLQIPLHLQDTWIILAISV